MHVGTRYSRRMFRLRFSVLTKDLAKVNCSGGSFSGADIKELQCLLDDDHLMKSVFCKSFVFLVCLLGK